MRNSLSLDCCSYLSSLLPSVDRRYQSVFLRGWSQTIVTKPHEQPSCTIKGHTRDSMTCKSRHSNVNMAASLAAGLTLLCSLCAASESSPSTRKPPSDARCEIMADDEKNLHLVASGVFVNNVDIVQSMKLVRCSLAARAYCADALLCRYQISAAPWPRYVVYHLASAASDGLPGEKRAA